MTAMLFAAIPEIIVDLGALMLFLGVLVATSQLPPVRWVWRQLISNPITRWQDERNAKALEPLRKTIEEHQCYIRYHLGPNHGTRPIHVRLELLEDATGVHRQTTDEEYPEEGPDEV